MVLKLFFSALVGMSLVACSDSAEDTKVTAKVDMSIKRSLDFTQISRGAVVFKNNCMVCHGANGEGQTDWKQQSNQGISAAPPLNGTGHAWHHNNQTNMNTIKNGTKALGGSMPAWKDKLTEQEILDVMAWFQSKWPDEIYNLWAEKVEKIK